MYASPWQTEDPEGEPEAMIEGFLASDSHHLVGLITKKVDGRKLLLYERQAVGLVPAFRENLRMRSIAYTSGSLLAIGSFLPSIRAR